MNNTTATKLTALFAANNATFNRECAVQGIKHHDSCNETVDTIHDFGSGKINGGNEEDAIASIVAGMVAVRGHAPNHLDFATRAKEAGVSLDGFYKGWNSGLKMTEDDGYCIDTPPEVKRKSAYLTKNDKANTLKPIWTGEKRKQYKKGRTMEQLVASLVKQYGKKAVALAVENAA
tara:strand:- start:2309 stop:2836 length:528 start_codon:yes stop_codon:yes gene_type:complete